MARGPTHRHCPSGPAGRAWPCSTTPGSGPSACIVVHLLLISGIMAQKGTSRSLFPTAHNAI